jgi:hypothetical protein
VRRAIQLGVKNRSSVVKRLAGNHDASLLAPDNRLFQVVQKWVIKLKADHPHHTANLNKLIAIPREKPEQDVGEEE